MKLLPLGIENFKELIDKNYYYIDKTKLIPDVINEKVILYTRPRRFGKTLNMSMLYYFFSIQEKENAYLFNDLNISKDKSIMQHQNQYPILSVTLKNLTFSNYDDQLEKFAIMVSKIIDEFSFILTSSKLSDIEKKLLLKFQNKEATSTELTESFNHICTCLKKYYNRKVIILIDEYDVPLNAAYQNGYYEDMVNFLKNLFTTVLKTNDHFEKAILTGCLRISKESIFTGLNNFEVNSVLSYNLFNHFGFTNEEIKQILKDYQLDSHYDEMKEWYDGYLFGQTEIYNPWSSLQYIKDKTMNSLASPQSYWANTSGNDIVKNYIENADSILHEEFEQLIKGDSLIKKIKPELTYREMEDINNIYSFLLFTGYLKVDQMINVSDHIYSLKIPNVEVKKIYENIFEEWFKKFERKGNSEIINAYLNNDTKKANRALLDVLQRSISYYDNYESFYHGFLVGLFQNSDYKVISNRESGEGRFDIALLPKDITDEVIVIECKYSNSLVTLIKDSEIAAQQIVEKNYRVGIQEMGYPNVIGFGISFYKKQCQTTKANI